MARHTYIPKADLQAFTQSSNLMGAMLVFHCWGTVFLMMALFVVWPNPLTFLLAFFVISARQLSMALLMHDAAHGVLFKSDKLNVLVGQYGLAIFVGADMPVYRKYHLRHHRHTQQDKDPDLSLSAPFPITRQSFVRKVLRDLSGMTAIKIRAGQIAAYFNQASAHANEDQAFHTKTVALPYVANLMLFGAFYLIGYWWLYFALWLLPLMTGFQLVLRIRNIAEHAMTSTDDNPLTHARTTKANLLERIFLAPYWVNYHVEHHAYMYVPCWQLKRLHLAMGTHGHWADMEMKPSYKAVLKTAIIN